MGILHELQALDEPAKKKVLIVATAIAMAIVIYFWLAYFNNFVAGISQSADEQAPQIAVQSSSGGISFWQNAYMGAMNALHGLANILQAPREYLVKPPQ